MKISFKRFLFEIIIPIIGIITLYLLIQTISACFIGSYYMVGSSMIPSLKPNDKVLVNKYKFKFNYLYKKEEILKRGDLIIFYPPFLDPKNDFNYYGIEQILQILKIPITNKNSLFLQRVIGLPGERIKILKGKGVFINGQYIEENYILEKANYSTEEITIPEENYFILGDNRNNSFDSHRWGFLPKKRIIGKVILTY